MRKHGYLGWLALALSVIWLGDARAQEADLTAPGPWKYGVTAGLNLSQSSFSGNWAGGDNGSIAWALNANLSAERQFSSTFNHSNLLQIAYGQTSQQRDGDGVGQERVWDTPQKSTDLIAFESIGRFTLGLFADPYVSLRLDSQFLDESNPLGTLTFNPIKLKESAGFARVLQKTEDSEWITRLGLGFRQTIARTFADAVTLEEISSTSNDGGIEWQTTVTQPILDKKVLYSGNLLVFQPLFYSNSSALEQFDTDHPTREAVGDYWKTGDVSFQNLFTAQITEYLSVNLFLQWVYDKFDASANLDIADDDLLQAEINRNVRKGGQFKQTLALGLTYRLF